MSIFLDRNFNTFKEAVNILKSRWNITEEVELKNDSENIVYFLKGNPKLVLRLTENRHKKHQEIISELEFITYLNKSIPQVTKPTKSLNNTFVESLDYNGKMYHLCVFEMAKGKWIENKEDLTASLATSIGELTGNIHYTAKKFRPSVRRKTYLQADHLINASSHTTRKDLLDERDRALAWYNSLPQDSNSYGLIHADIHYGNFFSDNNNITLFDFDDCSYSFYAHELGLHLYYAYGMHMHLGHIAHYENYKQNFIQAYKAKNDLDPRWYDLVEDFLHFRTVDLFLWIHMMFDMKNPDRYAEDSISRYNKRLDILKLRKYTAF
jgi:Ser/Thr protein kinase RdoA (MazF antagonist)